MQKVLALVAVLGYGFLLALAYLFRDCLVDLAGNIRGRETVGRAYYALLIKLLLL